MGVWTHQKEAVDYAEGRRIAILHLGMGCGKTRIAFEVLKRILRDKGRLLTLVLCPKAVIPAWKKQGGLWAPELRVCLLDQATSAQKKKALKAALADRSPLVIVVNYESACRIPELEGLDYTAIVYDEVHKLKKGTGKYSQWAAKLNEKNQTAKILALTGTLIPHSFLDLWGIYRVLEFPHCETFGKYKTHFLARHAVLNPHVPGMILRWKCEDEIAKKLDETTFCRKSEDVLDLPPLNKVAVEVEMTKEEATAYLQLRDEFAAEIETEAGERGLVTPANHMVGLLRMLQACQGAAALDGSDEIVNLSANPSKAAALSDIMESLHHNEPLVVFCRFRADIDNALAACKKLGRTASELSGRRRQLEEWQDGKTAVLVVQIQSGGTGIDLARASYGVFMSVGHSLAEYLQAVARLHRPGQEKTTHLYSLISTLRGDTTVDGRVHEALSQRKEVIDHVIDWFRS
jgi:superfamily II DNA or RNA helicase